MAETPDPAGTPAPGETPKPEAPSNNATPPAAPVANAPDPAEVERLRKETEQKDLRIRQLENEKAAKDKAESERAAKELEENNEFKTLHEQSDAKVKELEAKIASDEKQKEVNAETAKVLADYSPEVQKLVTTTGLTLTDTDETTVTAFKAKLEELKGLVGPAPRVNPNNPAPPPQQPPSFANADGVVESELTGAKFDEVARSLPGIASMMSTPPQQ